jgi:coenzyme F420-reducing hydrogenase delta subunit/ferredoxin
MLSALAAGLGAIERAFDQAFGAAANPWRHLGALGFFFFWIVVASGIYVYAFFDTTVEGAYRSVERLTLEQWYAGGIMRSLHRYASDAFLLVVVLHLLKELALGRFAGFRWFSWITGVPLLWLALGSGLVGYWLVWDRLAQFVAVGTSEWLDWLPLFGGSLARNFLTPESVKDRLFTLVMFLHIGLPLALLLGMFVHIQRVNHADAQPPRVLGWGAFACMIALAIARPALSQPPADLAWAPQALGLDWFYLSYLPFLYERSAGELWAVAAALTATLFLLPALARKSEPVAEVDLKNCNGCARCFADCPYAAIVMRPREDKPRQLRAVVLAGLCASCGICTGACPSSTPFRRGETLVTGIDMPQQPIDSLREALELWLASPAPGPRVAAFACSRAARPPAPPQEGLLVSELICIGMLPPSFIEYALRSGADGVLLVGCREGECAYRLGERWTVERLAGSREPHLRAVVPSERLRFIRTGRGDEAALGRELLEFRAELALRPSAAGPRAARWEYHSAEDR